MQEATHTVVIGGGCLGIAAALATQRRLRGLGKGDKVVLLEKSVLASGLSARHSGIVRAANADSSAATLASTATSMWRHIERHWGVPLLAEQPGAIWIARADAAGDNPKWRTLQTAMEAAGLQFARISRSDARDLCTPHVRLNENEVFYHEPEVLQLDPAEVRDALYAAVAINGLEVREGTTAVDFARAPSGAQGRMYGGRICCGRSS